LAHQSAILSAQRTLSTEATGLQLLHDAMGAELGQAFAQAVETILAAPGRVIISGMGK
jgi:arabinose-5-phosphate isomerase